MCTEISCEFEFFFHTTATEDILVIWADDSSGGLIVIHLPYKGKSHFKLPVSNFKSYFYLKLPLVAK